MGRPETLFPLDSRELQGSDIVLQALNQGITGEQSETPQGQEAESDPHSKHPLT